MKKSTANNMNHLKTRRDDDLLMTHFGYETAFDETTKKLGVKAVFETYGGKAKLLSSSDLMGLRNEYSMSLATFGQSAERRDRLEAENGLVEQAHTKLQIANANTELHYTRGDAQKLKAEERAVKHFPRALHEAAAALWTKLGVRQLASPLPTGPVITGPKP